MSRITEIYNPFLISRTLRFVRASPSTASGFSLTSLNRHVFNNRRYKSQSSNLFYRHFRHDVNIIFAGCYLRRAQVNVVRTVWTLSYLHSIRQTTIKAIGRVAQVPPKAGNLWYQECGTRQMVARKCYVCHLCMWCVCVYMSVSRK